jgi:hypothetical protein
MPPSENGEPSDDGTDLEIPSIATTDPQRFQRMLLVLLILLSLQMFGVRLMHLPLNRVIELRYCQDYYNVHDPSLIDPNGNITEQLCKLDSIQQQLAWLQGLLDILLALCGASERDGVFVSRIRASRVLCYVSECCMFGINFRFLSTYCYIVSQL